MPDEIDPPATAEDLVRKYREVDPKVSDLAILAAEIVALKQAGRPRPTPPHRADPLIVPPAHDGAWGWLPVPAFRVPRPLDTLELPDGDCAVVVEVRPGPWVGFDSADLDDDGDPLWGGHLRDSATADGLYLYLHGGERDGYSLALVSDGPCDSCGANRAHWRVKRGGRPDLGGFGP